MKKLLTSPIFLVVWIICCGVVSVSLLQSIFHILQAKNRVQTMVQQTQDLEKENADMKGVVERAASHLEKERIIREKLGMQLPNETVVQVLQTQHASPTPFPSQSPSQLPSLKIEDERVSTGSRIGRVLQGIGAVFTNIEAGVRGWFSHE